MMIDSSLPSVVCRMAHVLFTLCACYSGIQHILCCVFVLFSWSYVPYIANFSGLSIGDCPFGILQRLSNKLHYLGIININHIFICNTVHTKN
jgi:hypothetical protein